MDNWEAKYTIIATDYGDDEAGESRVWRFKLERESPEAPAPPVTAEEYHRISQMLGQLADQYEHRAALAAPSMTVAEA